jgi:ATP phosphoribosyltransferase
MSNQVLIGIPKGSLEKTTLALFAKAGFAFYGSERSLWLTSNDIEIRPVLLKPQEIPSYVANGSLDGGLSGLDWIAETGVSDKIRILADLCYSKRTFRPVRWVLAVAEDSPYQTPEDLQKIGDLPKRIATELKGITASWLAEKGVLAEVDFSWGATEAKVPAFADAIVECTETGASLQSNGLRIIDTVFESTTQFFANKENYKKDEWKRNKLDAIALLLKACLAADHKVPIRVVVSNEEVSTLSALIPGDVSFTVFSGDNGSKLIDIIVEKEKARDLIPLLARHGHAKISVGSFGMFYE